MPSAKQRYIDLSASMDLAAWTLLIDKVLLALTAALLAVMPWTEYFSNWDNGFRGGQDCEFGLLAMAAILGLGLLLAQRLHELERFVPQRFAGVPLGPKAAPRGARLGSWPVSPQWRCPDSPASTAFPVRV